MKKQLSIFSCSALVLAIVASCSSNAPTMNTTDKVDSIKVSQLNKIQTSENGAVKVNLRLSSTQPKFGIKAVGDGWISNGNVSEVHLKLHKLPGADARARFDSTPLAAAGSEKMINTTSNTFSSGIFDVTGLRFNNLKPNSDYYLSARAYSTNFYVSPAGSNLVTHPGGGNTITGTGTKWATPGRGQLFHGDKITIGSNTYTVNTNVTAPTDTSVDVFETVVAFTAPTPYSVKTNITGLGSVGGAGNKGMAASGSSIGGGTAPALVDGSGNEEKVNVSPTGTVSFPDPDGAGPLPILDFQFQAASPIGTGAGNTSFDVAVQIMKDVGAYADGAVRVYQGGAGDPESITP